MHQKLSLGIIIGFSLVVIASWIFFVVPELKNSVSDFEIINQRIGLDRIVTEIGEDLPEPIRTRDLWKQEVISREGNNLEIRSTITTSNLLTDEIIFESESVFLIDKNTRNHTEDPEKFFMFPNNVQKKTYEFIHPLIYFPTKFVFEEESKKANITVYIFSCNLSGDDISYAYHQFSQKILSDSTCRVWVEPITGIELWFEKTWHDYYLEQNQIFSVDKGSSKTSEFTKDLFINIANDRIKLFYLYDTMIPILLVVISSGSVLVVFVNQTLKIRTKELKETRKKKTAELLYEIVPDYIITLDKNNLVEDCNKKILDELGFSKDEVIGVVAADFLIEEEQKKYSDIMQRINSGEQVMEYTLYIKRKDGSILHAIWNSIPMYDDNNEYNGYVATGVGLTEIDKLRDELVKKEKLSTVGQLASNLAHDIKNPLASMKQSLEIIQRKTKDDEVTRKEAERANRVIKRIEHQVNQVLNYVKTPPLQKEDTTVLTILKQSLDIITIPDNITIKITEKDFEVKWDDTQISVVFTNIILNAIQAIGKDKGTISIRVAQENDSIKIEIENSGPNIPEKDLDKIFEPLFTTKMEGTGLGLAGCKNIIQSHKGTITVSNNPVKLTIKIPKSV